MRLYGYWRSSASWRVRIALHLKDIPFENKAVHLVEDGGHHRREWYAALNPMEQVPTLEIEEMGLSFAIGQSLAILDYLENQHPTPALLPEDPVLRARAFQLAEVVNSGIQPLQNLSVLQRLAREKVDAKKWAHDWIEKGLRAYDQLVEGVSGDFSVASTPSWADICLIPQLYNARRYEVNLDLFPRLQSIEKSCEALDAFQRAHPDQQPDAAS